MLSMLLKWKYYRSEEAVIYFVESQLKAEECDRETLINSGFLDVVSVFTNDTKEGREYRFDELFFYSLDVLCPDYLKTLRHKKLVLVYEGITSCQLRAWSAVCSNKVISDLDYDIDEFWMPDADLLLDKDLQGRCREFSLELTSLPARELNQICNCLNQLFYYTHDHRCSSVLFLDRYLSQRLHGVVWNKTVEKLLLQEIYNVYGSRMSIKRHPYEADETEKYQGFEDAVLPEQGVPWELIYLNEYVRYGSCPVKTYVFYNSFAPVNLVLLFGDRSHRMVCLEPLLAKYACLEDSYLDAGRTREIFQRLAEKYEVDVTYIESLEQLFKTEAVNGLTEQALWDRAEADMTAHNLVKLTELRAFRLQLDLALAAESVKTYWITDGAGAAATRTVLHIVLPDCAEAACSGEADFCVDCNGTLADYGTDPVNVLTLNVIEGLGRPEKEVLETLRPLRGIENIYLWGAVRTTRGTFAELEKLGLTGRIRGVLDSFATGEWQGYPVTPFDPAKLPPKSFIYVCAASAYWEIAKTLKDAGLREGLDFQKGFGIITQPEYNFSSIRERERESFGFSYPEDVDELRASFLQSGPYTGRDAFYYAVGGAVFAPSFVAFCQQAVDLAVKEEIHTIFPLMREGELYAPLLQAIIADRGLNIHVTPLWVSRKSSYLAMAYHGFDQEFFRELCTCSPKTVRGVLRILGISKKDPLLQRDYSQIDQALAEGDSTAADSVFDEIIRRKLNGDINNRIQRTKDNLGAYLRQHGGDRPFLTVDFGSTGRLPQAMDNCCPPSLRKVHLFLLANGDVVFRLRRGHDIRFLLLLGEKGAQAKLVDSFASGFSNQFYETVTMGNLFVGSAVGYEKAAGGLIRVMNEQGDSFPEPMRRAVEVLQHGIRDFCTRYLALEKNNLQPCSPEQLLYSGLASFCRLVEAPFREEAKAFGWFQYNDGLLGKQGTFIPFVTERGYVRGALPEDGLKRVPRENAYWRQGAAILYPKRQNPGRQPVAIYGKGRLVRELQNLLRHYDVNVACIVDEEASPNPVIRPEDLERFEVEDVIIANADDTEEAERKLRECSARTGKQYRVHLFSAK